MRTRNMRARVARAMAASAHHVSGVLRPIAGFLQLRTITAIVLGALLTWPTLAFAQSPWENSATAIKNAFTNTIGHALAPVAIIVGGLMWMFGEGGAKRHIAALIMGGGMVLAATAFSTWLFGAS